MYQVIVRFNDLQDNDYTYEVGDAFPRAGLNVTEDRFVELAGRQNKQGIPLIARVKEEKKKATESKAVLKEKKEV